METRFSVASDNTDPAVAWLSERGFAPCRIEDDGAQAVLIFPSFPDDRMAELAAALPVHLSSKIGIVVGDRPPFSASS